MSLEERYTKASFEYHMASDAYEDSLMADSGVEEARTRFQAAGAEYAHALSAVVRGRLPTFLELLSDPTIQVDHASMILKSIAEYAAARPATARWSPARQEESL